MMKRISFLLAPLLIGNMLFAFQFEETRFYMGATHYDQTQEDKSNTIILGKEQDEDAFSAGITQYVSFDTVPWKQMRFYGDYSYTTNTDKSMHQFFLGSEISLYPSTTDTVFNPYLGAGVGYSSLLWGSDPIASAENRDTESGSLAIEFHVGLIHAAFQKAALDLTLRHVRYEHSAEIKIGTAESELVDKSQTGLYLGVRF